MDTKQNRKVWVLVNRFANRWLLVSAMIGLCSQSWADELAINNLEFSSVAGSQVQIQMEMSGPGVAAPKIFQTDNPGRIALDFNGVKSNLAKKSFPINQGPAGTVYVVEASGRTRVIINLLENVPYETKTDGNKFYVLLKSAGAGSTVNQQFAAAAPAAKAKAPLISQFLPEQTIKSIDFRRGSNGEGRLLLGLSTPNTVVDAKQQGGKVVLKFLNTSIPESLIKSFDVSDFATPVQKIEAAPKDGYVSITITPNNPNYDYSSYQSDNLLTVEFRPLTPAEKEAQLKERMPYVGSKLSLNFQEIEVKSVLMILADHVKTQEGKEVNIVTTDSVAGSMALHVNDVPWDQVLDVVMKLRGLSKRENGNVILVGPTEEIKAIEEKELEARKITEQLEPLKTENIQINYAKASDICNVLMGQGNFNSSGVGNKRVTSSESSDDIKDSSSGSQSGGGGGSGSQAPGCGGSGSSSSSGMGSLASVGGMGGSTENGEFRVISPRGAVIVDARTNTLIVKDTANQLEEVHKMIAKLDVPVRQVSIEARVVIASTEFAKDLGVKFGVAKMANVGGSKNFAIGGSGTRSFSNAQPNSDGNIGEIQDTLVDLGAKSMNAYPPAALGMTLMRGADYVLNLELSALQNDNSGEILANPRLVTSDRVQARIKQGLEIPYVTVSQNGTQTQFKDAVLELNVTPQITPDGSIIMDLIVKKDNISDVTNASMSGIEQRRIQTLTRVNDGETIVLGGVYESETGKDYYKVPFFSDIPGIGFLFSKKIESEQKRELLIFVTPKIVKDSAVVN